MPKGGPRGGRPRRIEKSSEDRLRAVLMELDYSPRRMLPRIVPLVVRRRDALLSEALDRYPDHDPALLRKRAEHASVEEVVLGLRVGRRLADDPKVADAFERWLDVGGKTP